MSETNERRKTIEEIVDWLESNLEFEFDLFYPFEVAKLIRAKFLDASNSL